MTTRRQDAATAGVGLGAVGVAGGMRHAALVDAYREKTDHPVKRPRLWQEQRFLRTPHGRKKFLTAAGLTVLGVPPAAVGTSRLMHRDNLEKRDQDKQPLLAGVKESLRERNDGLKERAPGKLVLGNYAAGAGVTAAAGGLTHLGLKKVRMHPNVKAGTASVVGLLAGTASLPAQAKLTEHASHGHYTVTPTGVRRKKTKPVRPSTQATVIDGRQGNPGRMRSDFGKKDGEQLARIGAKWTTGMQRLADTVERPKATKKGRKFVSTGRKAASGAFRELARDATHIGRAAEPLMRHVMAKANDPGASMSRTQRRALVTATAPPIPFVGDAMQSAQAARLSPEPYRRRTAAQNFGSGQAGGLAGNVAGALGAAKLAQSHHGFDRAAQSASDKIDNAKAKVRSKVGLKPAGPSVTSRVLNHHATPQGVKRMAGAIKGSGAGRLIAHNPKVAGLGAIVGGAIGGQAGQQAMYSHVMTRDDRYRQSTTQARRGTRLAKRDTGTGMTRREELQQLKRKQHAAVVSAGTNAASVASLGLLGAAALPGMKHRGTLVRVATTTGTAAGGASALNGLHQANLQRKDLKARQRVLGVEKSVGLKRSKLVLHDVSFKSNFTNAQTRSHDQYRKLREHNDPHRDDSAVPEFKAYVNGKRQATKGEVWDAHDEVDRRMKHPSHWERASGAYKTRQGGDGERDGARWTVSEHVPVYRRRRVQVAAGVGVVGAGTGVAARHRVNKAYGVRVPRMRRGFLRQTRGAGGVVTSTVRGGLIR